VDQIFIKDLLARGIIGINPDERDNPQDILINIIVFVDTGQAGQSDNIADTVSYSMLAKKVRRKAETAQRFTVEALAEDIANLCLEEPQVKKVRIRVEKPRAVQFAASVGVEIERSKI
jgi:FolB domain-containing protein